MCKNKLRLLMKSFIESQFDYCPVIWMFHSRLLNNRINRLHERALRLVYKDSNLSFEELLNVFFQTHDPTTPNRQGADIGTQYRSVVFFHNDEQKKAAVEMKTKLSPAAREQFNADIVTEIKPAEKFYRAEEYHQQYFSKSNF